jgi:hypothetical protein
MSDTNSLSAASTTAIVGSVTSEEPEENVAAEREEMLPASDPAESEDAASTDSDGEADFAFVYREIMNWEQRREYLDLAPGPVPPVGRDFLMTQAWVSVVAGSRRVRIRGFLQDTLYEEETVNRAYVAAVPTFVAIMLRRLWERAERGPAE